MDAQIAVAIISLIAGLAVAAATYWFTKKREREAEWRKEKLAYYKTFVESLSGAVEGDSTPDGQRNFAQASNNLLLFAPQSVIEALDAFWNEIRISNFNRTKEQHDKLLAILLMAIRRDIGVFPIDNPSTFKPQLWASGADKCSLKRN
ncbi:MAG: hypothetical protein KKC76_00175 [Proteobacteria bacterium]|nr:hypothetical protein [Pseudomonadota bacterium]MBU4297509.1 hypothetical protein [Pseudomonadota bacterium]MCG2749727.1 hypothetical protein [Desulfobulbaceae bacterium]